jgi:hypothetical protein
MVKNAAQPLNAQVVRTYAEFEVLLSRFAAGLNPLVVVVGTPGLGKSESIKKATGGYRNVKLLKGHVTPFAFYLECYWASRGTPSSPIILDDVLSMIENKDVRGLMTQLAETTDTRMMMWLSTKIPEGFPDRFWTSSPVCVITNEWKSRDTILTAIASRASSKFVRFEPTWAEAYRHAATWFWDQEIFDYLHGLLPYLRLTPDLRILVDAWRDKKDEHRLWPWRRAIENYIDPTANSDPLDIVVAKLLADNSFKSNLQRSVQFALDTGKSSRTFYRHLDNVKAKLAAVDVERLRAKGKSPDDPVETLPMTQRRAK